MENYKTCPRCEFMIPKDSIKCPKCSADLRSWLSRNKNSVFFVILVIIFGTIMINKFNTIDNKSVIGKVATKKTEKLSNVDPRYRPQKIQQQKLVSSDNITSQNFTHAWPGEKWIIQDNNVSVMKSPEAPTDKNMYMNNLSTIIGYGDIVEVTATKGMYWKKVSLYNNGRIYASGWILSDTVGKAKKI